MKRYNIGLIGFGCVGQGFYEVLKANPSIPAQITKIVVKDASKERAVDRNLLSFNIDELINDPAIDMVVELIDDVDVAYDILKKSLSLHKPVVTANKKMVAENLSELISLQTLYKTPILYEGAVCGSIPIIQTIDRYYQSENITSISGIFNGSTNYILTKILEQNLTYDEALQEAQENGFAESDPILDVGGFDPKFKLSILVRHAFGHWVHPDQILHWGINKLQNQDFDFAKANGLKIKLVAKADYKNGSLSLTVAPHFVNAQDPLFYIDNENNVVIIDGEFVGRQTLAGKGAGSHPTGLAVLSDVKAIIYGTAYHYKIPLEFIIPDSVIDVYVRYDATTDFVVELFESISEKYVGKQSSYVLGSIKLNQLKSILNIDNVNAIVMTQEKKELQTTKLTYSYAS
ncbi:MAG TPA: homoserine dehydrogenase [Fulvivirga sp.]|nr:homoserine dehydrogenase [Fulvivirga sp.]